MHFDYFKDIDILTVLASDNNESVVIFVIRKRFYDWSISRYTVIVVWKVSCYTLSIEFTLLKNWLNRARVTITDFRSMKTNKICLKNVWFCFIYYETLVKYTMLMSWGPISFTSPLCHPINRHLCTHATTSLHQTHRFFTTFC